VPIDNTQLVTKIDAYKSQAYKWQERRHSQWAENWELYRDNVIVNRLTQRQSVNIPLIKTLVRTLLAKLKSRLDLVFEDLGGDKQKDIFKNEYWKHCAKTSKLKAKDRVNKKQVMLFGRSFWKLFIADRAFNAEVEDPHDILVDRNADPADIDGTAMCVSHIHIYRTLKSLESNPAYDRAALANVAAFYSTNEGLIRASENAQSAADKAQRMEDMGVPDVLSFETGETLVELNEHYVRLWNEDKKRFEFNLVTMVDGIVLRGPTPLDEILGKTKNNYWLSHLPLVTWADDIERIDFWNDAVADIARTINKIINAFFSQFVEGRTFHNLGMHFYDATAKEGWQPNAWEPMPFGFYPLPGKPADVLQRVDIDPLDDNMTPIDFLIGIAEKATAATATQQGASEKAQITLGEVQLLLNEAEDRISDMQEPYEDSWLEFGEKWAILTESAASQIDAVKLYKKSYKGNYFEQTVKPSDWRSEAGYSCDIRTKADQERDQLNGIQKLLAIKAQFPGNMPLDEIVKTKMLDLGNIPPEQQKQIMDFERQVAMRNATMTVAAPSGAPPGAPVPAAAPASAIKPAMNVPATA
jgi:hypothetical protein